MTVTNTQILPLPNSYITGCNLGFLTTTTLSLSVGQVRDNTNQFDIVINAPITITGTATGLNGLDTGALANNKFYSVFAIGSSSGYKPGASIISLSSTAPVLPNGYDLIRLIGVWPTNGTSQLTNMYQVGMGSNRAYYYDSPPAVLTNGAATAYTAVNLANFVPAVNEAVVIFNTSYTPLLANNNFKLRPTGSTSGSAIVQNGLVATVEQDSQVQIVTLLASGNPSVDYTVTAAGDKLTLLVSSFSISL